MLANVYPLHPQSGRRLDMRCPVVVCDACGTVIDADRPGNLLWHHEPPLDGPAGPFHVHKARACAAPFDEVPLSQEIGTWLAQLVRNHDDPLEVPGGRDITLPYTGDTFRVTEWEAGA